MGDIQNQTFIEKCYKDKTGKVTLAQSPNLPLMIWFFCAVVTRFPIPIEIADSLRFIGTASLLVWASFELLTGSNYFRRFVGLIVLVAIFFL